MPKITVTIDTDTHAVVPREPTREMLNLGRLEEYPRYECEYTEPVDDDCVKGVYRAMLAAAPPVPDQLLLPEQSEEK